jgi:hypothetical protein
MLEGDERRRPDNLGVIFTSPDHKTHPATNMLLGAWECRKGALQEPNVQYLLNGIAERFVIYIYPYMEPTKRKIMGPPKLLAGLTIEECG